MMDETSRPIRIVHHDGSKAEAREDRVVHEEPLEIQVNGANVSVTMRTPGHDFDLVVGFLLAERIIESAQDIASIAHCSSVKDEEAEDNIVRVVLQAGLELPFSRLKRNFFASSSCGVCGKATIESVLSVQDPIDSDFAVTAQTLYALPAKLRTEQAAFDVTGGLHAAALFSGSGELGILREDVGRHNAVDKVVGAVAQRGGHCTDRILLVSGRIGFEIVQKAAAARIPVLAGVSAPSSLAVRLGEELGIAVVGFLRGESMNVYSCTSRILAGAAQ